MAANDLSCNMADDFRRCCSRKTNPGSRSTSELPTISNASTSSSSNQVPTQKLHSLTTFCKHIYSRSARTLKPIDYNLGQAHRYIIGSKVPLDKAAPNLIESVTRDTDVILRLIDTDGFRRVDFDAHVPVRFILIVLVRGQVASMNGTALCLARMNLIGQPIIKSTPAPPQQPQSSNVFSAQSFVTLYVNA